MLKTEDRGRLFSNPVLCFQTSVFDITRFLFWKRDRRKLPLGKKFLFRYSTYMGRKLNLLQVERVLKDKGFRIFTPLEFGRILKTSFVSAQKFLERYTKKRVFIRVKKGLYIFNLEPPHEMVLANRIYRRL